MNYPIYKKDIAHFYKILSPTLLMAIYDHHNTGRIELYNYRSKNWINDLIKNTTNSTQLEFNHNFEKVSILLNSTK